MIGRTLVTSIRDSGIILFMSQNLSFVFHIPNTKDICSWVLNSAYECMLRKLELLNWGHLLACAQQFCPRIGVWMLLTEVKDAKCEQFGEAGKSSCSLSWVKSHRSWEWTGFQLSADWTGRFGVGDWTGCQLWDECTSLDISIWNLGLNCVLQILALEQS